MSSEKPTSTGPYELLQRLAMGGMGEVYVARRRNADFEKKLALKLLLPHLTEEPEFVKRFMDEARLSARMNHPNIVQVFDFGQADGRYFLAMALVEGVSLSRLLRNAKHQGKLLPIPVIRLIAAGLCEGLAYVHKLADEKGQPMQLVHRDINPSNILISTAGAVLLMDFGIAKSLDASTTTRPGLIIGKAPYLAPEQTAPIPTLDSRADVYAAAITLYETLTGVSPFKRESDFATVAALREEQLTPPEKLRPDTPPDMARVLIRGASKDPNQRLSTAEQLLQGMLDGPIARPGELGALAKELCGPELARFEELTRPATQTMGTASLKDVHVKNEPPRRSHTPRNIALAVAALAAIVGVAVQGLKPKPVPAPAPPPAVAITSAPPVISTPPPVVTPPAPAPERVTSTRPRSRAASNSESSADHIGYLSADADPWATLFIGGHEVEKTPVSRYPLPAGRHVLLFRNPDLNREISKTVFIKEGKVERVRVQF